MKYIATIDCGTTNSRVYIVDEQGTILGKASQKVGVRDTAITGSKETLRQGLADTFQQALMSAGIKEKDIYCVLSSGMITSEIGLVEIPHLWPPVSIAKLSSHIEKVEKNELLPCSCPVFFIRGIKNRYDPQQAGIEDVGYLDFMRGEETQIAGLIRKEQISLPAIITTLSSHTKYMSVNANGEILGGITTLSGQLFEALIKETFVGKSVNREDDFDISEYFPDHIVETAWNWMEKSGLLRCLMFPRFLDTLLGVPWYDRRFFVDSLLAIEDMKALSQVKELSQEKTVNFVLIGKPNRCQLYKYLLINKTSFARDIQVITDDRRIDQLSIHGALEIARIGGIL